MARIFTKNPNPNKMIKNLFKKSHVFVCATATGEILFACYNRRKVRKYEQRYYLKTGRRCLVTKTKIF